MSSLPFDSSSSWDSSSSGHHGSGHHGSGHSGSGHHGSGHSGSCSGKHYGSHSYNSHSGSHQGWQQSSVHGTKIWEHKPHHASSDSFSQSRHQTAFGYTSSGTHYSSGTGHHFQGKFNAPSHHAVKHSVMNCSSSDDISVVKIYPDGDIWWKGSSKGSLQGIYIKNHSGNIVAKFVDHRVWLWSSDRYVDVGYAKNAQEAVYDVCVKYRALGS